MQLRNRVAEFRLLHDWTMEELARRTGLSTFTLSRLEAGDGYTPQSRVMLRLCKVFGAELGRLFFIDWQAEDVETPETPETLAPEVDAVSGWTPTSVTGVLA